jgi:hypothetical protein
MQRKRVILTGANFGRSMAIGDWWFQDGVLDYSLDSTQWGPLLNKLRFWAGFELGTSEYFKGLQVTFRILSDDGRPRALEIAVRIKEELEKHGYSSVPEAEEPRSPDGVLGHLFESKQRDDTLAGVSDLLGTNKATGGDPRTSPEPDSRPELPPASPAEAAIPAQAGRLKEALAMIDPTDDELWTREGAPKIAAVEDFYEGNDLTRKLIEEVWPGFGRKNAAEIWGEPSEQATG